MCIFDELDGFHSKLLLPPDITTREHHLQIFRYA